MKRLRWVLAAALTGAWAAGHAPGAGASVEPRTWLVIADLHVDPFDRSTRPAPPGRDGNFALLASALRAMRAADPVPAVVVVAGDSLAHHFGSLARRHGADPNDAGIRTMRQIAEAFDRAFPASPVALVLGNNDAPCGDYRSDFGGRFLRETAAAWAPLVNRGGGTAPAFRKDFPESGSYVVRLPGRQRLVVLDTVPMAAAYRGTCSGAPIGTAENQLKWLRRTLRSAPSGPPSVVAMHVPPGYDAMATGLARGFVAVPYLSRLANQALIAAQTAPSDRVAFSIAAHAHRFDVRVFGNAVTIVAGSISPIYGNQPAFYRLRVTASGEPLDVEAYAYAEASQRWSGPRDFDRAWDVDGLDAASLRAVHRRLRGDAALRRAWGLAATGWAPGAPIEPWRGPLWRTAWCAQTVSGDGFDRCAGIAGRTRATVALAAAIAALALLGIGVTVAAIVRKVPFRSRRNLVKL